MLLCSQVSVARKNVRIVVVPSDAAFLVEPTSYNELACLAWRHNLLTQQHDTSCDWRQGLAKKAVRGSLMHDLLKVRQNFALRLCTDRNGVRPRIYLG